MMYISVNYDLFVSLIQTIEHLETIHTQTPETQAEWLRITQQVKNQAIAAHKDFVSRSGYNDGREVAGGVSISPSKTGYL